MGVVYPIFCGIHWGFERYLSEVVEIILGVFSNAFDDSCEHSSDFAIDVVVLKFTTILDCRTRWYTFRLYDLYPIA